MIIKKGDRDRDRDQQEDMNPFRRRLSGMRRDRNGNNQQIRTELSNMRYPPEVIDVVLNNNEFGDTGDALEWIGQNEHRIDELLFERIR